MEQQVWLMNTLRGRPSLTILRQKYRLLADVGTIDETWIDRECVVVYRYPEMVAGNWHQDVLYHGRFSTGSYETYVWIKDYNGREGRISKTRLAGPRFAVYIPL